MAKKPDWITKTKRKQKTRMVSIRLHETTIVKLNQLCKKHDSYKSSTIEGLIEWAHSRTAA